MKQLILIIAILFLGMAARAQTNHKSNCQELKTKQLVSDDKMTAEADRILGTWLIDTTEGKIEIYKRNGKYFCKIYNTDYKLITPI